MKFNIPSKPLYYFVSAVSKVINSKNAMTILNNFLFSLEGNRLRVVACDMENTLVGFIQVLDSEGEGSFCVDAARIVELLKELPDQGVAFIVDDDTFAVEIQYSNGNFNLMGIDGSEYPYDPEKAHIKEECLASFTAPVSSVLRGINTTIFAVGTDDLRPQMKGVFWDIHPEDVTFVATDTKQLVRFRDNNIKPGVATSFVLPPKPCNVLRNVFGSQGEITVMVYEKCVVFENSQFNLTCTCLKGRYPDYERVIPKSAAYSLTVGRDEFIQALKRVSVFSGGAGLVKFKISPERIKMRADDGSACGNALESVPCHFTGSTMLIGFSFRILLDMFEVLPTEEGVIQLTDPGRPGLIVPTENTEGTELVMLSMPMGVTDFPED